MGTFPVPDGAHSFAMSGEIPRLAVSFCFTLPVVSWGRLSLKRCVGDGRGRAEETLGRKPSGLCPKPEASAERPCRTAALPGTAVERRTHPYAIKPNLGAPLSQRRGGGTCPDPVVGLPLHTSDCNLAWWYSNAQTKGREMALLRISVLRAR